MLLIMLFGVGAAAGSAGGGFGARRISAMIQMAIRELRTAVHHRAVTVVRVDHHPVGEPVLDRIAAFAALYLLVVGVGAFGLALSGADMLGSVSGSISAFSTMGPAFGVLTGAEHPEAVRLIQMALAVLGRTGLFALTVGMAHAAQTVAQAAARAANPMTAVERGPTPAPLRPVDRRIPNTVLHMTGVAMLFAGVGMLLCLLVELMVAGGEEVALLVSGVLTGAVGFGIWRTTRVGEVRPTTIFYAVAVTWLTLSLAGTLPYLLSGTIDPLRRRTVRVDLRIHLHRLHHPDQHRGQQQGRALLAADDAMVRRHGRDRARRRRPPVPVGRWPGPDPRRGAGPRRRPPGPADPGHGQPPLAALRRLHGRLLPGALAGRRHSRTTRRHTPSPSCRPAGSRPSTTRWPASTPS